MPAPRQWIPVAVIRPASHVRVPGTFDGHAVLNLAFHPRLKCEMVFQQMTQDRPNVALLPTDGGRQTG